MLGGGNFTTQNKKLPGTYINFVSANRTAANISERGVAAVALELNWGNDTDIFSVSAEDFVKNALKIFGYSYGDTAMQKLRELFLNVKTRIPQARNSSVYFYNNYIDSSNISYDIISKKQKEMINNSKYQKLVHLTTYGIISIQRSYVVSENNIFKGVEIPYTKRRDKSYKNIGRIIIKEDKNVLSKLKEKLGDSVGTKYAN